ncbi:MAG: hypothetical protein ACI8QS_001292 [Planctomycetota bacterium]|jgi:hypothetical protein
MSLIQAARQIDSLLRGGFTQDGKLKAESVDLPVRTMVMASIALGAVYGACMGLFAVLRPDNPSFPQLLATTVKVPLLFLATLLVTYPSLYVFAALARSPLTAASMLKLLIAAVAVNLAVLASFGPVTGFFTLSTDSYAFMVLLSVTFFVVSGAVGLGFLSRALNSVFRTEEQAADASAAEAEDQGNAQDIKMRQIEQRHAKLRGDSNPGRSVLRVWVVIYAVVGAQMAWIMRPFIGAPNLEFSFFRQRGGNFIKAFFEAIGDLLNGQV